MPQMPEVTAEDRPDHNSAARRGLDRDAGVAADGS